MEDEIQFILDTAKESMQRSITHLEKELLKIRAGRANPAMLESVKVEYYGAMTPLSQVSNISTPDARTLSVQPWEKSIIQDIERAIMVANLGLNPQNNGEAVIINIPPLTEERRRDLVKMAKAEAEDCRVGIRSARKDANDEIKKLEKDGLPEDTAKDLENEIQELTNAYNKKVDDHLIKKEEDIMKI
ncbi:MAG: ribosome recycling factor [Bacteroidetes bacterium]|uniref:Ribosome-recycling factor n=1 Tax=Phaeocystidibacter marisrubri TaxID=1577780 RepID=A0A6L3ZCC6_9FLAO|nr:ribosome recycling factor [Phaeocystidibacter marisrubri]KAB2815314.1 ribosome recycling factor [Phaeocystidibacter marisrubri]TNE31577.1 MAG: ribosome recycling factor [Bacteroidota bacterium]